MGIGIGKQREVDLLPVGEILQDLRAVVTDGGEPDPLFLKFCFGGFQLNQLPFAVGSPVCRTKKQQDGAFWSLQGIEGLVTPKLVAGGENRSLAAYGEANAGKRLNR